MRSALDKLISGAGLALAVVLLVAGGLLTWANVFIGDQVHDQLTMQDITMPEGEAISSLPKADADALEEYAGSPMDTGPEAKAFADHYILAHMNASSEALAGEPMSYSQVSSKARELGAAVAENPDASQAEIDEAAAWADLKLTLLDGNTLRGLLLYGYAFATIGTIAGIAAIVSFVGGALLLVLAALGLRHARRVEHTAERPVPAYA
jgi:cytoskeletal protein RodZ